MAIDSDVLVIGGGLAGITAALTAARAGVDVRLVTASPSTLRQASGLIDALGYIPPTESAAGDPTATPTAGRTGTLQADRPAADGPIVDPFDAIDRLPSTHPYRIVGPDALRRGLALFDSIVGTQYAGDHTDRNALVPTMSGGVKPTARYPAATAAGLASDERSMLVVDFSSIPDLDGRLVADGLRSARVPFSVGGVEVAVGTTFRDDARITRFAEALDANEPIDGVPTRQLLTSAVEAALSSGRVDWGADDGGSDRKLNEERDPDRPERIGFPAVLGLDNSVAVRTDLEDRLGVDVFEIPMGPPSVPGRRLEMTLLDALDSADVRFETSRRVVSSETADVDRDSGTVSGSKRGGSVRVSQVHVEHTGRTVPYEATAYVLATGGLVGGGIESDRERVREPVFDCYVSQPADRYEWFVDDVFGNQPYARFGVRPDDRLRPLGPDGDVQYENVFVAGGVIGGADVALEKSASGVSLATGFVAGRKAAQEVERA